MFPWQGGGVLSVIRPRYLGLFLIAIGMAAHSLVVGRLLGSSFFMLAFFWGWVAAAAWRGRLESAQSMAIVMIVLLATAALAMAFLERNIARDFAYYTFALYPAVVSWVCALIYIRHLQRKDQRGLGQQSTNRQKPA
jgi:Ca2+/Na+ antiporter